MDFFIRFSKDISYGDGCSKFCKYKDIKKFFLKSIQKQDNYFFYTQRIKDKKLEKGTKFYFVFLDKLVATAELNDTKILERERDDKFDYGYNIKKIKVLGLEPENQGFNQIHGSVSVIEVKEKHYAKLKEVL